MGGAECCFIDGHMNCIAVLSGLQPRLHINALRLEAVKQRSSGKQSDDNAAGPNFEQELTASPVHEGNSYQRHYTVEQLDGDIALCRVARAHASLFEDDDEEAED